MIKKQVLNLNRYIDVSEDDELDELDELDEWRTIFNLFDVDGDQAITKEVRTPYNW